jgi:hypothetical protein
VPVIEVSASREVPVPAERAWAVVADYGHDPRWRHGVSTMAPQPPGPVTVGTTTAEVLRFAGRTYRSGGLVTEVDEGRGFAWRTTSGLVAHGGRTVRPLGARSARVTLRATVRPVGAQRLLAPVLRPLLGRALRRDLDRLAALLAAGH